MTLHIKPTMLKRSDHAVDDSVRDCWAVGVFDKGKIKYFLDCNGQEGVVSRSASDLMLEAITFKDKQCAYDWACGADEKSPFFNMDSVRRIRNCGIVVTMGMFSSQVSEAYDTAKLSGGTNVLRSPSKIGETTFANGETVELVFDVKRRIKFSEVYLPTMRVTMECMFQNGVFWFGDGELKMIGVDE